MGTLVVVQDLSFGQRPVENRTKDSRAFEKRGGGRKLTCVVDAYTVLESPLIRDGAKLEFRCCFPA